MEFNGKNYIRITCRSVRLLSFVLITPITDANECNDINDIGTNNDN